MKLHELEYAYGADEAHYRLPLTPTTVAELTDLNEQSVYGLMGPGQFGEVRIYQGSDMCWDDVAGDMSGCDHALLVEPNHKWMISHVYDVNNKAMRAIAGSFERLNEIHDHDYVERVITRYAALWGYDVESHVLYGQCQGDEIGVLTVTPRGEVNFHLETFRNYWSGEVYGYFINVESPLLDGEDLYESVGGFIGDDCLMSEVAQYVRDAICAITANVRESVKAH